MSYLLRIDSSARVEGSASRRLSARFSKNWCDRHPEAGVVARDLAAEAIPHISETTIDAFYSPIEQHTPEMHASSEYSKGIIAEFVNSAAVVIATPMYNYSIPSSLKAYFDHLARVGHTFRFTEEGPQGLVQDKPVIVIVTRGSIFTSEKGNHVEPYLRTYFSFIGIKNVIFVIAEGLSDPEQSTNACDLAAQQLDGIAEQLSRTSAREAA